ncbi:MAG TPA: MSMEG_0565 family glycosyltransferase [Actinomycetes bacterium]|nr:MSMEG_0565 family glycosyltransferase [Actinomycetes bacterium]
MSSSGLPPVSLVTYSTKPRGGVVHTLALGEALHRLGTDVLVVGLGDPTQGFFRATDVPTMVVDAPEVDGGMEERVAANIDALEVALTDVATTHPLLHTQDCIAARAAARVRDAGRAACLVLRTVHHVDDFSSQVLMDCQRQAILEPDQVFVVSHAWQRILQADYGVAAEVVPNGVDAGSFAAPAPAGLVRELRARVGATARPLLLSVGGIEPRKGSDTLVRALARLARTREPAPVLAVLGGHSFQDHRAYRERVLDSLGPLGLELGIDVVEVGTVPAGEISAWYHAADALAFPSEKEGFGLAALEAMCAGLPVVASDLEAFREWLVPDRDALVVPVGDDAALAAALSRVLDDKALRDLLVESGRRVAETYTWEASARRHLGLYVDTWARAEAGAGR